MKKILIMLASVALFQLGGSLNAQDLKLTSVEKARKNLIEKVMEKLVVSMPVDQQFAFVLGLAEADKKADGDIGQEIENEEEFLSQFCLAGNREQREIAKWFAEERSKLPTIKTADDLCIEKERAEQMKNRIPNEIRAIIKNGVADHYYKWAQKGEYEKTAVHKKRLAEQGPAVFDSLCFQYFDWAISKRIKIQKRYDADRDGLIFRFQYKGNDEDLPYVEGLLPISPAEAQKIDKVISWHNPKGLIIRDGYYFPATFPLYDGGLKYDVYVSEPDPVTVRMSEVLNGSFIPEGDHVFDYTKYSETAMSPDELSEYVDNALKIVPGDETFRKLLDYYENNRLRQYGDLYDLYIKYHGHNYGFYTKEYADKLVACFTNFKKSIYEEKKREEEDRAIELFLERVPIVHGQGLILRGWPNNYPLTEEDYRFLLEKYPDSEKLWYFVENNHLKMCIGMSRDDILLLYNTRDRMKRAELLRDTIRSLYLPLPTDAKDKYGSIFIRRFLLDLEDSGCFNMTPIYEFILEASPYYTKKYRSGTLEERIERFRRKELGAR